jgi:hypothetical protein
VTIRVVATDASGKVGSGTVTLKAASGSLEQTELTLDAFGTAQTNFSCSVTQDPDCSGSVRISGTWVTTTGSVQRTVEADLSVNVKVSTGAGGGTGDGGAVNCMRPQFKLTGNTDVSNMPLGFDSSNAAFELHNTGPIGYPFAAFGGGRGIDIVVRPLPDLGPGNHWHVFLFHTEPTKTGVFTLGAFDAKGGMNGTGTRIFGPGTRCNGFEGDNFTVTSLELNASNEVVHISADIAAHCPIATSGGKLTRATGVVCF